MAWKWKKGISGRVNSCRVGWSKQIWSSATTQCLTIPSFCQSLTILASLVNHTIQGLLEETLKNKAMIVSLIALAPWPEWCWHNLRTVSKFSYLWLYFLNQTFSKVHQPLAKCRVWQKKYDTGKVSWTLREGTYYLQQVNVEYYQKHLVVAQLLDHMPKCVLYNLSEHVNNYIWVQITRVGQVHYRKLTWTIAWVDHLVWHSPSEWVRQVISVYHNTNFLLWCITTGHSSQEHFSHLAFIRAMVLLGTLQAAPRPIVSLSRV